jgi:hypothetical protein
MKGYYESINSGKWLYMRGGGYFPKPHLILFYYNNMQIVESEHRGNYTAWPVHTSHII